jgi:hypothetical protein
VAALVHLRTSARYVPKDLFPRRLSYLDLQLSIKVFYALKLEYGDHPCKIITDQWLTLLSLTEQLGIIRRDKTRDVRNVTKYRDYLVLEKISY